MNRESVYEVSLIVLFIILEEFSSGGICGVKIYGTSLAPAAEAFGRPDQPNGTWIKHKIQLIGLPISSKLSSRRGIQL